MCFPKLVGEYHVQELLCYSRSRELMGMPDSERISEWYSIFNSWRAGNDVFSYGGEDLDVPVRFISKKRVPISSFFKWLTYAGKFSSTDCTIDSSAITVSVDRCLRL
ncbi:hypothetical protein TNCT_599861 [Trichonephila clavata]|uniref:Uncharacterized protein n=1 Tax=Trichonephila clavata TaxID=2740835 RepID=A0A8X6JR84_TRICU|nr:hypothetical protein TNCT_599861 [Trichonephila clavata]